MGNTSDFRRIDKKDAREAAFPAPVDNEYRVHFNEDAYNKMKAHTATTNEVELCGVLIGDVCRDNAGFFLKIDAVIEGQNANNYGAQVTFTHQTWEHINAIKDKQHPNQRIVGWYHTHPGFGVFLSGMDMFIQENTFNHPYQVAIVVETKQNVEGCFVWMDGKSVPISRYWVGAREQKLATGPVEKFDPNNPSGDMQPGGRATMTSNTPPHEAPSQGGAMMNFLLIAVVFVCGMLLGRMFEARSSNPVPGWESEMYSLFEFAAQGAVASQDLAKIDEKLSAIDAQIKKGDGAAATQSLTDLSSQIKTAQAGYMKKKADFHNALMETLGKRQSMGERVDTVYMQQNALRLAIANVYILRVGDLLNKNGAPADLSKLTPQEIAVLKGHVDMALALAGSVKTDIESKFPKLLDTLYPEQRAPEPTAPEKK